MFDTLKRHYLNLRAPDGASLNWSWQWCRRVFLKKVGKVCVCCGSTKHIQVHHILPRHIRPDLVVDMTNLIALCKDCHFHIGHLNSYFTYNSMVYEACFYVREISVRMENKKAA